MIEQMDADWRAAALEFVQHAEKKYAESTTANKEGVYSTRPQLPLQVLKDLAREFRAEQWRIGPLACLDHLTYSLSQGQRNHHLFSIFLLTTYKHDLPEKSWYYLDGWLEQLDDFVVCDQLAINLGGRLAAADKSHLQALIQWCQLSSPYRQRFAVITICMVHKKHKCRPKDVLKCIEPLMKTEDHHVQYAVAFAIQQIERVNEALSVSFLKKWKGKANHEIFRESMAMLSPQAKMTLIKAKSH